jgi:cytochrome c553
VTASSPDTPPRPRGSRLRTGLLWFGRWISWKTGLLALAALGVIGALFVAAGGVDVSADKPDGWVSAHLLHFVFKRSVAARAHSLTAPADLNAPSRVRLAAQHYDMVCANCHGRPGFGQSVVALSMNPRPQYLPKVLGQFTDADLHQILEHGVKYSAMPAWATQDRGDELWSMVAFLRRLPTLDAAGYRALTASPSQAGAAPVGADPDAVPHPTGAAAQAAPPDEFLYAAPAFGFSDAAVHDAPVAVCARCHGPDGSGQVTGGEAPNLTLQDAAYLQSALQAYVQGARKSGYMQTVAAQLSGAQIAALARYYAALPVATAPAAPADPALVKRGEIIALEGVRETATPACANCHEAAGASLSGAPRLAGQSATYLARQLAAMAQGGRGASRWWNPMPAVAHHLSPRDIQALATYYAGLKPSKAGGQGSGPPRAVASAAKIDVGRARTIFEARCMTCHVNHGRGDLEGEYPDLTIHAAPFVAQSLYAFRVGARPSEQMAQVTGSLSLDELASLAIYVNDLVALPGMAKPDPAAAARGASLALNGDPKRGLPACASCHGAVGVAALPLIPRLQGQSAPYLRGRLNLFAKPYAQGLSPLNPMPLIAAKLTDGERADLAAYFASAPPTPKPRVHP